MQEVTKQWRLDQKRKGDSQPQAETQAEEDDAVAPPLVVSRRRSDFNKKRGAQQNPPLVVVGGPSAPPRLRPCEAPIQPFQWGSQN